EKPAQKSITQNEFRQQSPRKGKEQHVNQVQTAHGLKFCEIRQTWGNGDHQCDQKKWEAEQNQCSAHLCQHGKTSFWRESPEPPQQQQRGKDADPFIPLPTRQKEIRPAVERLPIC